MSTATPAKTRVFLSYARGDNEVGYDHPDFDNPDKSFIRRLYNDLDEAGFDVWWDRERLPSRGIEFDDEIGRAVEWADRLIFVSGPAAVASPWVAMEWQHALKHCKVINPILRIGSYPVPIDAFGNPDAPDFTTIEKYKARKARFFDQLREDVAPLGKVHGAAGLPAHYLDRPALLREVIDNLTVVGAKTVAISAVQGMGGIGKTVLAEAVAADCGIRRDFPDGVIRVEFGKGADILTRQATVGKLFNITEFKTDWKDNLALLNGALYGKRALILLDNVWDLQAIEAFKVNAASCRILFTTRKAKIADAVGAATTRLDVLDPDTGAALVLKRAGWDAAQTSLGKRVSVALKGHMLALVIAAAKLKERGPAGSGDLIARYESLLEDNPFADLKPSEDESLELGEAGEMDVPDFEKSLALSYADLTDDLKRRFHALGILTPNAVFDVPLAAAIWEDSDPTTAENKLITLVNLELAEKTEDGRYRHHPLLRAYARMLMKRAKMLEPTFARYADAITVQAKQFQDNQPEAWIAFEEYLAPHLAEVGDTLVTQYSAASTPDDALTERALKFALNMKQYLFNRREVRRLEWLELGLSATKANSDDWNQALFLNDLGMAWYTLGEKRNALDFYERALPLLQAAGDWDGKATVLNNIGMAWADLGKKSKAIEYCDQAVSLFESSGNQRGKATALNNIGMAWSALGKKRKALDFYTLALPLMQAVGDRAGEAMALNNIGRVWDDLGDKRKALNFYTQALPIVRKVGNRGGEATTLNNIGMACNDLNKPHRALKFFAKALCLHRAVGDRRREATVLNNIGGIWAALGKPSKALGFHEQALPLRRAVGDRGGEAATCSNMAHIFESFGEIDKAIEYTQRSVDLLQQIEDVNAGNACANLERLKQLRDGGAESPTPNARVVLAAWDANGPQGVADLLRPMGATDEQIQSMVVKVINAKIPQAYASGGAESVRALLTPLGIPSEQIEDIIRQLGG